MNIASYARVSDPKLQDTKDKASIDQLQELRDDAAKAQAGLDYATELLTTIREMLPHVDIPYRELKTLPEVERNEILKTRRTIIRALVDKVVVYANGHVRIEGLLDGSEAGLT